MFSIFAGVDSRHVRSTTETSGPFNSMFTLETVFAAHVEDGFMFQDACHRHRGRPKLEPSKRWMIISNDDDDNGGGDDDHAQI